MGEIPYINVYHRCGGVLGYEDAFAGASIMTDKMPSSTFVCDSHFKNSAFTDIRITRMPRFALFPEPPVQPPNPIVPRFNNLTLANVSRRHPYGDITEGILEKIDKIYKDYKENDFEELTAAIGGFSDLLQQTRYLIWLMSSVSEEEECDWEDLVTNADAEAAYAVIKSIVIYENGKHDPLAMETPFKRDIEWACLNVLGDAKPYFWINEKGILVFVSSPDDKLFPHYFRYTSFNSEPGTEAYLHRIAVNESPPRIAIHIITAKKETGDEGEFYDAVSEWGEEMLYE